MVQRDGVNAVPQPTQPGAEMAALRHLGRFGPAVITWRNEMAAGDGSH